MQQFIPNVMIRVLVSQLSLKMFGCYCLLSQGDTKSESGYHYYQDLAIELLDEEEI